MKILAWDLERIPNLGYHWGLFDQNIGLAQLKETGRVISFAARWVGSPKKDIIFKSEFHDGREAMLQSAWDLMDEADALLSWNGKAFDTKHMNREFWLDQIAPPSPASELDLLRVARSRFKFESNKLDHVAQLAGLGGKITHEGFPLWLKCMAGDERAWRRMRRYNEQDVNLLIDLYKSFLPWIAVHPNYNVVHGTEDRCPACGSAHRKKDGTRPTLTRRYQRYRCLDCKRLYSDSKPLDITSTR